MTQTAAVDLSHLESRLEARMPRAFRDFVRSNTDEALVVRGFDPKTLLILNLELRDLEHHGHTRKRLFLSGDGCGNYHFIDLEGDHERVLLWSHDPPGIEETELRLAEYLQYAEQERRVDLPIQPGQLYICRTPVYAESILNPIQLHEWIAALNSTEGVEHIGYREGKNPFTREMIRVEIPGLAAVIGQKGSYITFRHGRAMLQDSPLARPVALTLAEKLTANLLHSDTTD